MYFLTNCSHAQLILFAFDKREKIGSNVAKIEKIKENQCPRRNFKLKKEEEEEEEKKEEEEEEKKEEEKEEICKHGCTFIIYMVKKKLVKN